MNAEMLNNESIIVHYSSFVLSALSNWIGLNYLNFNRIKFRFHSVLNVNYYSPERSDKVPTLWIASIIFHKKGKKDNWICWISNCNTFWLWTVILGRYYCFYLSCNYSDAKSLLKYSNCLVLSDFIWQFFSKLEEIWKEFYKIETFQAMIIQ